MCMCNSYLTPAANCMLLISLRALLWTANGFCPLVHALVNFSLGFPLNWPKVCPTTCMQGSRKGWLINRVMYHDVATIIHTKFDIPEISTRTVYLSSLLAWQFIFALQYEAAHTPLALKSGALGLS